MIYWVDIISDIVDRIKADSDKPAALKADAPYYMHGHPQDIIKQLQMKSKNDASKFKRYPVVILLQDFEETYGVDSTIRSDVSLNIVIANLTKPNYMSQERYDENFRTVLQPLYELFIKHIVASKQFKNVSENLVPHIKTDRLFWGATGLYGNEGNIFNDYIDAIEISSLSLQLSKVKYC